MKKFLLLITLLVLLFSAMAQDLTTNQLVYYSFAGDANNQAGSGLYNGTVTGAVLTNGFDGAASSAYSFDGVNDQIHFGDIPLTTESFTLSFWIKMPVVPVGTHGYRVTAQRATCTVGNFFDVAFSNSSSLGYAVGLEMYGGSNITGSVNSGSIDNPHEWNHITFVKDNANKNSKCYLNGNLVNTTAWSPANTTTFSVGNTAQLGISNSPCINGGSARHFNGTIDEYRIHTRVLSDADIRSMVPFRLESTFPLAGAQKTSVSSPIILTFSESVNAATLTTSTISVSGSQSSSITPTISSISAREYALTFAADLPAGEEITVTLSGVQSSAATTLATTSFSFTTSTSAQAQVVRYTFDKTLNDSSGNNLHLTASSSLTGSYSKDRERADSMALKLPSTVFLSLSQNQALNFGKHQDFSIAFWMKAEASNTERVILENQSVGTLQVKLSASGLLTVILNQGTATTLSVPGRIDDGLWHHVAITADRSGNHKIFVNAVERVSQAAAGTHNLLNNGTWYVGQTSTGSLRYGQELDDFRIYNRLLSASEVTALAPIYRHTTPASSEKAARLDGSISIEFGQKAAGASVIAGNFTITGSKSGSVAFTVTGGDTRVVKISPAQSFQTDEVITVNFSNIQMESGSTQTGSFTFETADVNKSLLINYPFEGNAANTVGTTLNGVVTGATLTTGYDGAENSAYFFDGNDYITSGSLKLDKESWAVAFWVKRSADQDQQEIFGQRELCTASNFMELGTAYNTNTGAYNVSLVLTKTTGGYAATGVYTAIEPNVWTHIVAVRDAEKEKIKLYKNGSLADETTFSGAHSILNNAVAGIATGNACTNVDTRVRFKGSIDEFRVYRRFLDPKEIDKLSSFRAEGSYPQAGSVDFSLTSSILFDLNEDIDQTNFSSSNITITSSGNGSLNYTSSVQGDSIRIKPDTKWPAGEALTVTLTNVKSTKGETLPTKVLTFTVATDASSLLLSLPLDKSIADQSSNGFTLTPKNTFTFSKDRHGIADKAGNFDVKNSLNYLTVTGNGLSKFLFGQHTDFTIATWFKVGALGVQQTFFNRKQDVVKVSAYMTAAGLIALRLENGTNIQQAITTTRFDDNLWHHASFVADRDGLFKIFVDGKEVASFTPSKPVNVSNLGAVRIGAIETELQSFKGLMDDFRIYSYALTLAEASTLASTYTTISPQNGENSIPVNQTFTIEFGRPVSGATAIAGNFTVTGSTSGTKTVVVTGGGTRTLTINPDTDFTQDETVTVSFTGLQDTDAMAIANGTFKFETVSIHKGMYVYYPFSGDATNQVSASYNGTVTGATLASDRNGNTNSAYMLNGSSYIDVGNLPHNTESFTYSFWINRSNVQESQAVFAQRATCNASNQMTIGCSWNATTNSYNVGLSLGSTHTGSFTTAAVSAPITVSTWTHVSLVRDNEAGLLKLYLNGSLEASQAFTAAMDITNSASVGIATGSACINVDATRRFTGLLDEVRIYKRAITAAEAAALPNLTSTKPVLAGTLPNRTLNEDAQATTLARVDTLFTSTASMSYMVKSSNDSISVKIENNNLIVEPMKNFYGQAVITVSAYNGLKTDRTFNLTVSSVNDAPMVAKSGDLVLEEDFTGAQTVQLTVTQPQNESSQTLTYSFSPDLSSINFATVTFNTTTKVLSVSPVAHGYGTQAITITASDGQSQNGTGSVIVSLNVQSVNDRPSFTFSPTNLSVGKNFSGTQQVAVQGLSPANESAQTITYTISPTTVSFATLAFNSSTGVASFTAVTDGLGSQVFTVTANDGQSVNNTYSSTFTLQVLNNQAPTLVQAVQNVTYSEDVPAQTVAADVRPLFTDPDSDALTYSVASSSTSVAAELSNHALIVTPAANFHGTATITLTASDASLSVSTTFTVTVSAVNDAPVVANAIANQTIAEDQVYSFEVLLSTFSDVDGDALSISEVAIVGLGTTSATWLSYNQTTRMLSGTAVQESVGQTQVTVTGSDGSLTVTSQFIVTVTNVNDAPQVISALSITLDEDASVSTYDLNSSFSDEDGNALSYTLATVAGDLLLVGREISGNTLSVTPFENEFGVVSFSVIASDGLLTTSMLVRVTVNAVNDVPVVINPIGDQFVDERNPFSLVIPDGQFSDADGDELSVSLTFDATWLGFSEGNGSLVGTPEASDIGVYTITVTASDGTASANYQFAIVVNNVNDAPSAIQLSNTTVEENVAAGQLIGSLSTIDQDANDTHTFELVGAGETNLDNAFFELVSAETGVILKLTGEADFETKPTYQINVRSTDAGGLSFSQVFTLTVANSAEPLGFEESIALRIYPNPATESIYVESNEILSLEILDLSGVILKRASSTEKLGISDLSQGVYLIRMRSENGQQITKRFVKN